MFTGALITAGATVVVQLAIAIFMYGRLTGIVLKHDEAIKAHDLAIKKHEGEIGQLFGHAGIDR